jgi:hypothetical protein
MPHSAYRRPRRKTGKSTGAIQFFSENKGKYQELYGRHRSVPYKIPQLNQPHKGQVLAPLLSCPPHLTPDYYAVLRHSTPPERTGIYAFAVPPGWVSTIQSIRIFQRPGRNYEN